MEGKRSLLSLTLRNVLSFGPAGMKLDLEPLNVLIGPNGSGKSNLIEALGLLRTLPTDLGSSTQIQGGWTLNQWVWKGGDPSHPLSLSTRWAYDDTSSPGPHGDRVVSIEHDITIGPDGPRHKVLSEQIAGMRSGDFHLPVYNYQDNEHQFGTLLEAARIRDPDGRDPRIQIRKDQSVLSHFKNAIDYPIVSSLAEHLSGMRLYRDWTFGRDSEVRSPQPAGQSDHSLSENARNLSLVLRRILKDPAFSALLIGSLQKVYDGIEEIRIDERDDDVSLSLVEEGSRIISARRLSDGTLRYLSLLALLCDPSPPSLMCIEEPELGLHPDIIPSVAERLIDASNRTQLIVTTHSADLISALWEFPESVVVCQRGLDGTTMKRLDPEQISKWLEDYSLGHLWSMGEIGGNRW